MDTTKQTNNITAEICFVGSLYENPSSYVSFGNYIVSKYDFYDDATRFYYDSFEIMYKTFSQTTEENSVNAFMAQDLTRLKQYKKYGGYKTITNWMKLANHSEIKSYYNIIKKYSTLREYEKIGFPVQKLMNHKNFETFTSQDVYRLMRIKVDKINSVINTSEDSVELTKNTTNKVKSLLLQPDVGIPLPWDILTSMFKGCRLGKLVLNGFLSNEGKSRNLMVLMAYIVLVLGEKFLLLSNEMDESDLQNCLIVTVINNPFFKKYHKVDIVKNEYEITTGLYKDDKGKYIYRKTDSKGKYIESKEDYLQRVEETSEEYRKVLEVTKWIDRKKEGVLFFKDVGADYSDQTLEFEIRNHKMLHNVKYFGYDTLKGFRTDDWQTVKQTATRIKEIMKELKMFGWAVFQLTDDTIYTDIFQLGSNNIANAKQMKHVADILLIGKKIAFDEYKKYVYLCSDDWGESYGHNLDYNKQYFAIKVDKNRGANKNMIPVFEIDLDLNLWVEVGYLKRREH